MKQEQFEREYSPVWLQLESMLQQLERRKSASKKDVSAFPSFYRKVCHYLALAQERRYSAYLVEYLNDLVLRGHHQLYRFKCNIRLKLTRFFVAEFPQLVRQEQRFIWLAFALLYLPGLLLFTLVQFDSQLVFSLLDPVQVSDFEEMYNPTREQVGRDRASDTDFMMFGYYIYNNISVAFRCFAGGLLFMVGTVVALLFNGLLMGAVAGHLANIGYSDTFFTFVIGHGSFELTAIGIAGGAGLKLGYSLIAPGPLSRSGALKAAAQGCIRLMYGVVLMLIVAAFIEAFWSSNGSLGSLVKYAVGAVLWVLVIVYLWRAGRQREA